VEQHRIYRRQFADLWHPAVFRQWALTLDAVYAYDPMAASNAFSLIGFSGTTCGVGDTEGCRATTAAKYRVQVGPVRLAALGQFGGYDLNNASNGGAQAEIGADIPHVGPGVLSFDAIYSYMRDAVSIAITDFPRGTTTGDSDQGPPVGLVFWPFGMRCGHNGGRAIAKIATTQKSSCP
jgi:hypothetical protein